MPAPIPPLTPEAEAEYALALAGAKAKIAADRALRDQVILAAHGAGMTIVAIAAALETTDRKRITDLVRANG